MGSTMLGECGTGYTHEIDADHEQVRVCTPDGHEVDVDVGMRPLLQRLWQRGIATTWSCEGDADTGPEQAYLVMRPVESGLALLRALIAHGEVDEGNLHHEPTRGEPREGYHLSADVEALDVDMTRVILRLPASRVPVLAQTLVDDDPALSPSQQRLYDVWEQRLHAQAEGARVMRQTLLPVVARCEEVRDLMRMSALDVVVDILCGQARIDALALQDPVTGEVYCIDEQDRLCIVRGGDCGHVDWRRGTGALRAHRRRIEQMLWLALEESACAQDAEVLAHALEQGVPATDRYPSVEPESLVAASQLRSV